MSQKPSPDRFDDVPADSQRRGVHRKPRKRSTGFAAFAWSALATLALTVAGVGALIVLSPSMSLNDFTRLFPVNTPTPTVTPKPTAAPTVDPAVIINVLNATGTDGMATQVGNELTAAGFTVANKTNASETVDTTTVYYIKPKLEGAARGVLQTVGIGDIDLSSVYATSSAQITVVLGKDLVSPPTPTPTATAQ